MHRKKKPFSTLKTEFFKVQKTHFFKGVNPCFWAKNANFILNLNLIKISLEIMLSDFAEKKETFFDLKKQHFSKSIKSLFFSKGLTHTFWQKIPILFLI